MAGTRQMVLLSILLALLGAKTSIGWPEKPVPSRRTFTAAVLEYNAVEPTESYVTTREQALELMNRNIDAYEIHAKNASNKRADIMVFPEYGIYIGGFRLRESLMHFAEPIPDPKSVIWNPCFENKIDYAPHDVQTRFSCMAHTYRLYLVANMAERRSCASNDTKCPSDGVYLYNTNVVYNPDGVLIAKYNKRHLYGEPQFNYPEPADETFFDTPFGRFGTFVCFDILYKDPAVNLVEKYRIDTVLYPTNWIEYEALPLYPSIGTHSSFAYSMGVNVLVANGNGFMTTGSGIYTPNGTVAYFRDATKAQSRLVIATIECYPRFTLKHAPEVNIAYTDGEFTSQVGQHSSDLFQFTRLSANTGTVSVCNGSVCCRAVYSTSHRDPQDLYALGAFDGIHANSIMYAQVCSVLKCTDKNVLSSCGQAIDPSSANTTFSYLQLTGHFNSSYTFPQIIVASGGNLALPTEHWLFNGSSITASRGFSNPLVSVTLLARPYQRDLPIDYNELP